MTQLAAPTVSSGASLATLLAAFLKFGASTATAVNAGIEGGAASSPNIAATTVDQSNMRPNANAGVWSAEAGFAGFVVTEGSTKGLQYSSASGLTATFTSGSAHVVKTSVSPDMTVRVNKSSTWTVALTATSDNYVYIKSDGSVGAATSTVGGPVATIPADSLMLSKVETNGTTVTGTPTDLSASSAGTAPTNYRTPDCWPVPSSTSSFDLQPGVFEVNGLTVKLTAAKALDVTTSGNYVAGGRKSNTAVYFLAANNGGAAKYALTSSTPSAVSIAGGATSGTAGVKKFRTISGLIYRYMGGWPLTSTAVLIKGNRSGPEVEFISQFAPVSQGYTIPTSYSTIGLTRFVPATAGVAKMYHGGNALVQNFYRTSTTGDGIMIMRADGTKAGQAFRPLINRLQSFQIKAASGTASTFCQGYIENIP